MTIKLGSLVRYEAGGPIGVVVREHEDGGVVVRYEGGVEMIEDPADLLWVVSPATAMS